MKKINVKALAGSILLAELAGFLAGILTPNAKDVYATLAQPPLSPPGWVFPVVWPILYALMGIAAYLVFTSSAGKKEKNNALWYYVLQLLVNFSWSLVFFGFQQRGIAVVVLVLLIILVAVTTWKFFQINKKTLWLLVPYLLWLFYALYLNIGVYRLN